MKDKLEEVRIKYRNRGKDLSMFTRQFNDLREAYNRFWRVDYFAQVIDSEEAKANEVNIADNRAEDSLRKAILDMGIPYISKFEINIGLPPKSELK